MAETFSTKDKMSASHVLGQLIRNPSLLLEPAYDLCKEDFPTRFHQIVFGSIEYLAKNNVTKIEAIDIDNYLLPYPTQHLVYSNNDGNNYVNKCSQMAIEGKFEHYYNTLKKISLLNQLQSMGFNTSIILDDNLTDPSKIAEMQCKFDNMKVSDIIDIYSTRIAELHQKFISGSDIEEQKAGKGLKELVAEFKETPEMGIPMPSKFMTTICRGNRLQKLYVLHAPSGAGKTRSLVESACMTAIPKSFNKATGKWEKTGSHEPTLFITTELAIEDIQTMILSHVSGVSEDKILDGICNEKEIERIDKATELIELHPIHIVKISNFDVNDIETIIKKYKQKYNIGYVFFDYIHTSIKVLSEVNKKSGISNMREDMVLLLFADRLKSLANRLNIHISSATQVNNEYKKAQEIDQEVIRGAKSIADKCDIAYAMLPLSKADLEALGGIVRKGFDVVGEPNLIYHVYKVRKGKFHKIKVWVCFDYGTCRTHDCFVTDNSNKLLPEVKATQIEVAELEAIFDKTAFQF